MKGYIVLIFLLVVAYMRGPVEASKSLQISGDGQAIFTVPDSAPFNALGSLRVEFRMHDWVLPSSASSILELTEYLDSYKLVSFFLRSDNKICERSNMDIMGSYGNEVCIFLGSWTDILVRYTRDLDLKRIVVEVWDTPSGNYTSNAKSPAGSIIDEAQIKSVAGPGILGGKNNYLLKPWSETGGRYNIAWLKWHSTSLGINGPRPRATDPADLGNWLFEDNGATGSSYDLDMTLTDTTFVTTPDLDPIAVAVTEGRTSYSPWISLRANYPNRLDATGSFSDELEPLKFQWTQIDGPSTLTFDDATLGQPTLTNVAAKKCPFF